MRVNKSIICGKMYDFDLSKKNNVIDIINEGIDVFEAALKNL